MWSKQFYHYIIADWLAGDAAQPPPPQERRAGRNREWEHVYTRDIISMPDKWEYPWFAAWDLAFHMVRMAGVDPDFAKQQLTLFLREWYMHPNGQIPAYEFAFGDVNPPVHAWAAWRIYKISDARGERDRHFLESIFQKLLLNFTWIADAMNNLGGPVSGILQTDWRELVLFHKYFHADTGRGCGASHQTGWTALAVRCLEQQSSGSLSCESVLKERSHSTKSTAVSQSYSRLSPRSGNPDSSGPSVLRTHYLRIVPCA